MITGSSVKNLVARLLHLIGQQKENVRPVVWQRGWDGPMTFTLVRADRGTIEFGRVDHEYTDVDQLTREIADAYTMFGVPTERHLGEAFPRVMGQMVTQ